MVETDSIPINLLQKSFCSLFISCDNAICVCTEKKPNLAKSRQVVRLDTKRKTTFTFHNDLYDQLLNAHHQQIQGCMPLSYTHDEMNLPWAVSVCHVQ
jgi:acyl carrier protein phosphodiesterase